MYMMVAAMDATLGLPNQETVYRATSFGISGATNVTIQGNVVIYLEGDFTTSGTSAVTLADGATLTIIQTAGAGAGNEITLNGGALGGANETTMDASAYQFFSLASNFTLNGGGNPTVPDLIGSFYAPQATMTMNGSVNIFGSYIAETIQANGAANFHYDESLAVNGFADPVYEQLYWILRQ